MKKKIQFFPMHPHLNLLNLLEVERKETLGRDVLKHLHPGKRCVEASVPSVQDMLNGLSIGNFEVDSTSM